MTCVVCTILFIHRVLVQHNKDQTQYAKVFCLIVWKSSVQRLVLIPEQSLFMRLSPSSVWIQHDDRIDTHRLTSVSIVYRKWLYCPSPSWLVCLILHCCPMLVRELQFPHLKPGLFRIFFFLILHYLSQIYIDQETRAHNCGYLSKNIISTWVSVLR